jgi:triacylglycerol esterase/lipase EstA (alpha/beta hydrolase family)
MWEDYMRVLGPLCTILLLCCCSCSHLKYAVLQAEYSRIQNAEPGQVNLKHMLTDDNFVVFGKTVDPLKRYGDQYLTIAAYSSRFKKNERVDTMFFAGAGTHYGLYLPEGDYTLVVLADMDNNSILDSSEVIGQTTITLNPTDVPRRVVAHVDITLTGLQHVEWVEQIELPGSSEPQKSLFYPAGAIRSLDDPIFDERIATLGMYDPASFIERVPTNFYALEEDLGYKIPVVFVHGIGGSTRSFNHIIDRLDRKRYKPWFFYYASGSDLEQLADLFYDVFLSGETIHLNAMPMIIVAHSMGGLVVREAINKIGAKAGENRVKLFISIATPFGGHPAAATGEKHGLIVLPAWRDVNPDSRFIRQLYRKPLPDLMEHHLIYAYQNPDVVKISENSDGVVPLSSQLHGVAQLQSTKQFGSNSSHTAILENEEVIAYVMEQLKNVRNFYPEEHLKYCFKGGYDIELSDDYSPMDKYIIHNHGKYWMAVATGVLQPFFEEQELFVKIIRGEAPPEYEIINGWLRFMREHPEIVSRKIDI